MEPPTNWLRMIENIRKVRQKFPAPVDTMGCDQTSDKLDKDIHQRFQVLVSLMLSSQTKDPITWAAVQKLKERGLGNVNGILKSTEKEIEDLIFPVGFYRRKAIYLKKVAKILLEKYDGDIPNSIKDLCDLPGVGPKMAHLCMQEAWNRNSGIGVDTHVHRIAARLGWVPSKGIKNPEDTRKALESWLPSEYWREINHLLVGFGQTICTPLRPKCDECFNNVICPSAFSEKTKEKKTSKKKPVVRSDEVPSVGPPVKIEPVESKPVKQEHDSETISTEHKIKVEQISMSPRKTRSKRSLEAKEALPDMVNIKRGPPKRNKALIRVKVEVP